MVSYSRMEREISKAEGKIRPKDNDSLQTRIERFTELFEAGEDDGLLSEYPASLFEPSPEILHKKPVDSVSEAEAGNDTPTGRTAVKSESRKDFEPTPLDHFGYTEVKRGWTERTERQADGSEVRFVHIDLSEIYDTDEPEDLPDGPAWDLGIKGPSYAEVKKSLGL